jgi:hypothetical protein
VFEAQSDIPERSGIGRVSVRTGGWQAWVDIVVAAVLVALPLSHGHVVVLGLPAVAILVVFGVWRWASDAEVAFDADGVRVTDKLWQFQHREPIYFPYAEGIQIVVEDGFGLRVAWVNGLRVRAGRRTDAQLETIAEDRGLGFERIYISFVSVAPFLLVLAAIPALFLIPGLAGWLLYYALYSAGLIAVLIPFAQSHRTWEAIAASHRQP